MTKYTNYRPSSAGTQSRQDREKIHPVWRGIGWALMFIFPIMGYFASVWLLGENAKQKWVIIPSNLLASGADKLLYVKIGLTLLIVFILYFLFQILSFIILRAFGPAKYGPMDIPRVSYKGRKRGR
jgi:hypothetical protein